MRKRTCNNSGFTLLEILLALTLGAAVITFANYMLVSMANLWMRHTDNDYFPQHVDGATLFLENALSRSEGPALNAYTENSKPPVSWERPVGFSSFDDPLLTFYFDEPPALLSLPRDRTAPVTCHLLFEPGEGLGLLWHSSLEKPEDRSDLRSTLISPFVVELQYCYYDAELDAWEFEDAPMETNDGLFVLPDFLRAVFTREEETRTATLYLPKQKQDVPIF